MSRIHALFAGLGLKLPQDGALPVHSPADGIKLAALPCDDAATLDQKITAGREAQARWAAEPRAVREEFLLALMAALKEYAPLLGEIITLEAGKTRAEGLAEAQGCADTLGKTVEGAALPPLLGMRRTKERPPAGLVGLITSFNFPLSVASWTLAPALLAGNAVLWKPSEKTPLVALAVKAVFDGVAKQYADLLHVLIGGREVGSAMVAHAGVDLVSATGSVGMGRGIKQALAGRLHLPPVLELGGNNGVILSARMTRAHLDWSLDALMNSFLGTTGQRCTNSRRLIVARELLPQVEAGLKERIETFAASGAIASPLGEASNPYGYGPLIDRDAYERFSAGLERAKAEGGRVTGGKRVLEKAGTEAFYVEPAVAVLPAQSELMHQEIFAPLLFVVPYDGDIDAAITLLNAPDNAGLVSAIYTQNTEEAERFAHGSQAGHALVNSPKGTGTPAYGMGFGGNKDSGEGEILNAADLLRPFTRPGGFRRVAWNEAVEMSE